MKALSEGRAVLVAFLISSLTLLATLGLPLIFSRSLSAPPARLSKSLNLSNDAVSHGRQLFLVHCTECHGFDARGDEGSNLHNIRAGDALIRQVITGGVKGEMPAYGKILNGADVEALTVYLRTLRNLKN